MVKEFKGQSGARIVIHPATFKEATALKKCIEKELINAKIPFDLGKVNGLKEAKDELNKHSLAELIEMLKNVVLSCDTSEDFEIALFKCLEYCTYKDIQIRETLFDDIREAREDYYTIVFECIKENVIPFFKGLLSKLSILKPINEKSQK